MNKWNYGGYAGKYDMSGIIRIGTGLVQVHNIFDELPDFMKAADFLFSDPPCSMSNINSFYTKANRSDYQTSYEPFVNRFWQVVDEIKPRVVAIEIFRSNSAAMVSEGIKRYEHFRVYNSTYYHNKKNRCQIVIFSDDVKKTLYPIEEMDEQDIIEYLCSNAEYNCIADPCMGQGLVGFYANKANKRFVGTELNEKRLAVLIERINKGKLNIKK